jgi:hypothetical protein
LLNQLLAIFMAIPDFAVALFLKPFVFLFVAAFILYPIRVFIIRKMPDGKLKRLFLKRIS